MEQEDDGHEQDLGSKVIGELRVGGIHRITKLIPHRLNSAEVPRGPAFAKGGEVGHSFFPGA